MKDLTLAIKLTTQGGQVVVRDIGTVSKTVQQANQQLDNTEAAGNRARKGLDNTAQGADGLSGHLQSLRTTAGLVTTALAAVGATKMFTDASQTLADFQDLRTRLQQLSGSAAAYADNEQYLIKLSNDHHKELTNLGNSYASLLVLQDAGLVNQQQARSMLEGMSNLQSAVGATTEQLSQSMYGLSQALASPVVHAEELSQVTEPLPGLLNKMDSAAGLASGGIRQLVLAGQMTSSMFRDVLIKALNEYNGAAAATAANISALYRDNSNAYQQMVVAYEAPINDSLSPVLQSSASLMQLAADHADVLVTALGVTMYTALGRGAASITTHTASLIKNEIELTRSRSAAIAAARSEVALAEAQRASVISAGQAAVAQARLTAANNALTAAQAQTTLATRAMRGAWAMLGGPLGIFMMAAGALAYFVTKSEDAAQSIEQLQKPVKDLREEFRKLTEDQRAATFVKWSDAAAEATKKAKASFKDLKSAIEKEFTVSSMTGSYMSGMATETPALKQYRAELEATMAAGKPLTPLLKQIGAASGVPESTLNQWVALAGAFDKAKGEAETANNVVKDIKQSFLTLDAQLDELVAGPLFTGEATSKATSQNTVLQQSLLKLYNTQKLNAEAVDQYGRALTGIDLEVFKAQFKQATKLPADATAQIKQFATEAAAAQATLNLSKYLGELRQQNALLSNQTQTSRQLLTINQSLAKYQGADPKMLAAARQQLQIQQQQKALQTDNSTLAAMQQQTALLQVRLEQGEQEYELQKALAALKSDNGDVIAAVTAEIEAQQLLNAQIAISEDISSGAFGKMLDDMSELSVAGNDVGDVLVESFGRVAQQLNAMGDSQQRYNRSLDTLKKKRTEVEKLEKDSPERAQALLDIKQTESRLQQEYFQNQMGQYSSLAGAASKMFSEQSSAREKLHKIETAFAAIETALALKKAAANALTAITNQGSGDPYTAFARIAAMAALMAGLGVFSGSASGSGVDLSQSRQESQGTGTVLGSDDKSASIANALDRIESLELDQYSELQSINSSIKSLNAGIENLAVNLVSQYGRFDESNYQGKLGTTKQFQLSDDVASIVGLGLLAPIDKLLGGVVGGLLNSVLGGISKTTKKLVDSGISFEAQKLGDILASGLVDASYYNVIKTTKKKLWGLSKSSKTSTEYSDLDNALLTEFGRIFTHIGTSISDAVQLLGINTNKVLDNFAIDLPDISFKDMSGDDIQQELEAIFSQQADLMAQYLVPAMSQYQQMGEGLYDTLIRVAQEQAVFNAQLDALGLSLSRYGDVSSDTQIAIAQTISELMGGIDKFQDATSSYFEAFYSDAEQFSYLQQSLDSSFSQLGLSLPTTREGLKSLVDGLDLTTAAGQQLFAQLMALVPSLDSYFDSLEQQQKDAEQAAAERQNWQNGINDALARLDMSDIAASLSDINDWYQEQIEDAKQYGADTTLLEQLYARKRRDAIDQALTAINDDTQQQLEALASSISKASGQITDAIISIQRQQAGWNEADYQAGQIATLTAALGNGTVDEQISRIGELQQAISARYNAESEAVDALASEQQSIIDNLKSEYQQLQTTISSLADSLASSVLSIRRNMTGWDEVGYQQQQIATLRRQLGQGSVSDQINVVSQLQEAINSRYQAEIDANQQLQDAANERYQQEVEAANAMRQAVEQLRQAADDMLLSDDSPALAGERLAEAQRQFNQLLNAARGGDSDAASQLQNVGSSYLSIAKDYYAQGSSEYADIFNQIQQAYRGIAAPAEPALPAAIRNYQSRDAELQQNAIDELQDLQTLLDDLQQQAADEQQRALNEAQAKLDAYQAQTLALQNAAISELTQLQTLLDTLQLQATAKIESAAAEQVAAIEQAAQQIVDAIHSQPSHYISLDDLLPPKNSGANNPTLPVEPRQATDSQGELLSALQQQQAASQQQSEQLISEIGRLRSDVTSARDLAYQGRRIA